MPLSGNTNNTTNDSLFNQDYINIFHADDDRDDKELLWQILSDLDVPCKLISVDNGQELLDLLYHEDEFRITNMKPDVIILDINMPMVSGFEVLQNIKHDDLLKDIPVYIFSTSSSTLDIKTTMLLGASAYFQKTYEYDGWKKAIIEMCAGAILYKKLSTQYS